MTHVITFCHIGKKDWEEANISIDRNLSDQEHSRYFGFKAAVLAHQGKLDEAKVWLDKYLKDTTRSKKLCRLCKRGPRV